MKSSNWQAVICLAAIMLLSGCSQQFACDHCGNVSSGVAYYKEYEPEITLCRDCAEDYYSPVDYRSFARE